VQPEAHVYDVTKLMVEHGLTTMPVATPDGHYEGMLRRSDLFERFAEMLSTQQDGAIITLEVDARDYSLSQLVFTIEQNGVKILSISSEPDASGNYLVVTLKLNVRDTARVRHMLEHYGYRVIGTHGEGEGSEEMQQRVDEFLRYLEV
jgi:signal-transduction protein with cAMP-binding, CBS, and nucleotidyltransferase domain